MKAIFILFLIFLLTGCNDGEHPTREGNAPITEEFSIASEFTVLSPIPTKWQTSHSIDTDYYKKMTVAWGMPIVASASVDDLILQNAAELLSKQLGNDSLLNNDIAIKVRDKLWQRHMKVAIYPTISGAGKTKQLPEFKGFASAAAYSATKELPTIAISDLSFDFKAKNKTENAGNSFSHELTHSIHLLAGDLFPNFENKLSAAYDNAINNNLWPDGAYINENKLEYLAEGAEIWFGWHTSYAQEMSRNDLLSLDPELYDLLNTFYNDDFPSFKNGQLSFIQPTIGIYYNLEIDQSFDYGIDISEVISQYQFEILVDKDIPLPVYRSHIFNRTTFGYLSSSGNTDSLKISLNNNIVPDPKNEKLGDNYKFETYRFILKLTSGHIFFDCLFTQAQLKSETQVENNLDISKLNSYCDIIEN